MNQSTDWLTTRQVATMLGMTPQKVRKLIEIGRRNGWHRLYWNTEITNAAARRLYDRFCQHDGHIRYRLKL